MLNPGLLILNIRGRTACSGLPEVRHAVAAGSGGGECGLAWAKRLAGMAASLAERGLPPAWGIEHMHGGTYYLADTPPTLCKPARGALHASQPQRIVRLCSLTEQCRPLCIHATKSMHLLCCQWCSPTAWSIQTFRLGAPGCRWLAADLRRCQHVA